MSVPAPTVLFHLTHGANLKNIIAQGGLKSFSLLRSQGINPTTAAYNGIQGRRAASDDLEAVTAAVHAWNSRKRRLFEPAHIRAALEQLRQQGWLDPSNN